MISRLMGFLLLGALLATAAPALGAEKDEERWDIVLEGFFHKGKKPLYIYGRARDGEWISAVGSSRDPDKQGGKTYNRSWYCGNLSQTPLKNGKMQGQLVLHMTPDLWVPLDHKSYPVTIQVDATRDGNKISGTWKFVKAESDDPTAQNFGSSGKIHGKGKPSSQKDLPDPVTFSCNMQGALIGGDPKFGGRCMVLKLGFEDGQLASVIKGELSQKGEVFALKGVKPQQADMTISKDGIKGTVGVPAKTLDMEPAVYVFKIDGAPMDGLLVGTYDLTVEVEGGQNVQIDGSFDGRWGKGIQKMEVEDERPWFAKVEDHQPVQPGEHPRLFFRKSDLPALRAKAQTPAGKAIISRLRKQLNGSDGRSLPSKYNHSKKAYEVKTKEVDQLGIYTMGHVAGYGLLYQLTNDKLYAELGKQAFQKALDGQRDRDDRYSFRTPGGALRAGPALGWYAVGYDLCYDGWDQATRERFGRALFNYDEGAKMDLEALTRGTMPPGSNHFGMQIGGASLALLAITREPFVDQERIDTLLKIAQQSVKRNISEGFGDGGFFAEGDGTGSMASQIAYLPALWAWKNVEGKDYINAERPNARMTALKWIYGTVHRGGHTDFWPIRGAYGHNVWSRHGVSGAGYYSIGLGSVTDEQKAALKWTYENFMLEHDRERGGPYDTVNHYPHHTVCAFVNWPTEIEAQQPEEVLPHAYRDSSCDFYLWRNRWQDGGDTVITLLANRTEGYMGAKPDRSVALNTKGRHIKWGTVDEGKTKYWSRTPMADTSSLVMAKGTALGVDFTGASGADTMLVTTGKADGQTVKLGGKKLTFFFPTADQAPTVKVEDDVVAVVGDQRVTLADGHIEFAVKGD